MKPEGELLQSALKQSGMSARAAAKRIDISDTRLRHIINGYQPVGKQQFIEVTAPAETLARIALILGVEAAQLRSAGRQDAADLMDSWSRGSSLHDPERISRIEAVYAELINWLNGGDPEYDSPPSEGLRLWSDHQLLQEVMDRLSGRSELLSWERWGSGQSMRPGRTVLTWDESENSANWYKRHVIDLVGGRDEKEGDRAGISGEKTSTTGDGGTEQSGSPVEDAQGPPRRTGVSRDYTIPLRDKSKRAN